MNKKCQKCGDEESNDDLRTLWMKCFYDMDELGLPFTKTKMMESYHAEFYTLRVCKECRARWMEMIKTWFHFNFKRPSPKTGIYVRHLGSNVEVTEEEFRESHPGIEPVRVILDEELPQ